MSLTKYEPRVTPWLAALLGSSLLFTACVQRGGQAPETVEGALEPAPDAPLPEGVDVLGKQGVLAFAVQGAAEKVNVQTVAVQGQPFDQALQAEVKEESASEWT